MMPIPLRPLRHVVAAVIIAGTLGISNPAPAQTLPAGDRGAQRGEGQRGGGVMRMLESIHALVVDLKLSDEQQFKVDATLQMFRDDIQAALQDPNSDGPARLQSVRARFEAAQGHMREVLTDEQKSAFDAGMERIRQDLRTPATQPGSGRGMQLVARLQRALGTLALSDDQKNQIQLILDDATNKIAAIRDDAASSGDMQAVREKAQALRDDVLGKLREVLTPEQQKKLQAALEADRPSVPGGGGRDGTGASSDRSERNASRSDKPAVQNTASLAASAARPIDIGQAIPTFSLLQLDGKPFNNHSLEGRPTVLIFGSYSSPALRDRIAAVQELADKQRNRAAFILVYTAEMFPAGADQPSRNDDEKIQMAAHRSMEERASAARAARDALKIKLPVAPDTMEAMLQTTLGVGPNGAAVLRADGTLAFRQNWADAFAIDRALSEMLTEK